MTARRATDAEVAALVTHLRMDPDARWVIPYIGRGTVWRDEVVGRDALGALDTGLTNLGKGEGERRASRITGRLFFRVSEARNAWRESTGDEQNYRLLEQYIDDERKGLLSDRTITVFDDPSVRIVDGAKRATAIYEASAGQDDLTVPIFVVRPRTA